MEATHLQTQRQPTRLRLKTEASLIKLHTVTISLKSLVAMIVTRQKK